MQSLGYTNVEQIQDLEVRMLPRGSLTTLQDLKERQMESGKMYTKMMKKVSKDSLSSKLTSLPTGEAREVKGRDEQNIQTSSGPVDSTSSKKLKRKHSNEVEGGGDSDQSKGHHKKKGKREDNR